VAKDRSVGGWKLTGSEAMPISGFLSEDFAETAYREQSGSSSSLLEKNSTPTERKIEKKRNMACFGLFARGGRRGLIKLARMGCSKTFFSEPLGGLVPRLGKLGEAAPSHCPDYDDGTGEDEAVRLAALA
jgi:hypothetical protein